MTGGNAAGGEMTVEGIKLANEKVGEVLGKKVELVILDNKSDKVEAANAASRLIEKDKVVTFFAIGEKLNIKPFYIGQPIGEIYSSYFIPSLLEFNHQDQEYLFEITKRNKEN